MDFKLCVKVAVCLCAAVQLTIGQECSNITFPDSLEISELTPEGKVIWEINTKNSATDRWKISGNNHFKFTYSSGDYQLSLATKIAVECQKERIFGLNFVCGAQKKAMNISVKYLDRYPPQWTTSKVKTNLRVLESDLPGAVVLDLDGAFQDADCYQAGDRIEVVPYAVITQLDASNYFAYNVTSKQVYLSRPFDYDTRFCESLFKGVRGAYMIQLKVYSEDNLQFSSLLTINVTFGDVDDEPPVFLKSKNCDKCISVCKAISQSHNVLLENDIQKNLTFDVFAKDFDTTDEELEYVIVRVNPEFLWRYIDIDAGNGTVSVQISADILNSGHENDTVNSIHIFLQVREGHTNQTSDNMTLTFIIQYPTPPTTQTTTALSESTTTFDLAMETTSDLTTIAETRSTNTETSTEGSTTQEKRSPSGETYSVTVTKLPTTTEIVNNIVNTDANYYKNVTTTLMICLIVIGSILLLVITAYIIYKCRQQPKGTRTSYATRSSPFVTNM